MRAAIGVFLVSSAAWAQAPIIEISGANFRPVPLAVAHPVAGHEGASGATLKEFDSALLFDFAACGLFQVLDRKSFLADGKEGQTASSIAFANWANVGAEELVKTQVTLEGEVLKADLRLFAVAAGREEMKAQANGATKDVRALAHALANAVYKHFTKETGPFETRISWVRRNGANKDVFVSDWDGKNAVQVTNGGMNLLPGLSPDFQTVAYTSYKRGKPEIFSQRVYGTATPVVTGGRMATGVAFSPDAKRIAYSLADGESAQIWVAQADGSNARQLTNTPFFINSSPTFSPDGKRLAFVSSRSGTPQVYVMPSEGGEATRLTFQGNYNQTPDWSPRGDLIAFTARDERNAFDIFTVNVETKKIVRLTQDQANNEEPSFSPNGRLVLFTSTRSGTPSLYVMTTDGNVQTALLSDKGTYSTPDW